MIGKVTIISVILIHQLRRFAVLLQLSQALEEVSTFSHIIFTLYYLQGPGLVEHVEFLLHRREDDDEPGGPNLNLTH